MYKKLSLIIIILSILVALSSNNWFQLWISLEINIISFIPLIFYNNKSPNAIIKYFFIQSLASNIFIFSIIINYYFSSLFLIRIISLSLLSKLGIFPLFFWFPQIANSITWTYNFLLITIQKFIPLLCLSFLNFNYIISISIFLSAIISILGIWNQLNLRKIIAYSSINHLCWIITAFLSKSNTWFLYLFFYSFIIVPIFIYFNYLNLFSINQIFNFNNYNSNFYLLLNFWSLGGLPPLLGFFPKWIIIFYINSDFFLLFFFLISSSLLRIIIYSRIIYPSIFIKNFYKNNNYFKMFFINLFFLIPLSILIF